MSSITLSSATRQNLLVAQDTASLLSTTQNRLATGKKVNTALDSPSSFFTAQGLDNRAGDLSNILDSISNGVQVIQAANTGITSLQKLVDNAKSVANQALQATIGYSTKSNVSTTITGATAADLRGTTSYANAQASSNVLFSGNAAGATAATNATKLGGTQGTLAGTAAGTATATTTLSSLTNGPAAGDTLTVNGRSITFRSGAAPAAADVPAGSGVTTGGQVVTDGSGNSTVYLGSGTITDLLSAIDLASGVRKAAISAGAATVTASSTQTISSINDTSHIVTLKSSVGADLNISGKADILASIGITSATGGGTASVNVARTAGSAGLGTLIADGSTLTVNGKTITFKDAEAPASSSTRPGVVQNSSNADTPVETDGSGNSIVYLQTATLTDVLNAVDIATGAQKATTGSAKTTLATTAGATNSSIAGGILKISTGTTADLNITGTGNALSALGLAGNAGTDTSFTASRSSTPGGLSGKTLTFGSLNNGTAVNVTFGDGTNGTVKTLDGLNAKLALNNMQAALDASGKLTISTTNDYASSTIGSTADGGTIGGTASALFSTAQAPVEDVNSQNTRKSLLSQFNQILDNIKTTAQDASFNGVNLLNGDTLKLTFNEKGSSTMNLIGVTFDPSGLGLTKLGQNGLNEFEDISSTNKVISSLTQASTALRQQASTFGSNLSVVQNRQDFNKQIINVLQTGSSKLTDADLNEEAANSQALSTRQSLTVSALSLANQAQQSVLQLLR
ncbi:hypothetical protein BHAOGJBA_2163 [Methylobacterium hispanicum]|uniref:Flagellin n=1 Tax=Methylobacterium hispanicum TaxID=270350 RepID=A0AAV4ZK19_9HYPH|nr:MULTISPECIES: DUF1522 domain-containing protein [Methylobacterium]GJD88643.1 hypothetical protein BHAOGJBA_2163 [Methylobacterium hispanicum]